MTDDRGFEARMARIEALTGALERCGDPAARAASRELVGALLDLHGEGLARILELAGDAGGAFVPALTRDGLAANLLLLHGLHPVPLEARIAAALDGVRSRLGPGAGVDLVGLDGDTLRVRLTGGCGGCPSSSSAKQKAVEDAVMAAAPDLAGLEFVGPAAVPGHVLLPVITL